MAIREHIKIPYWQLLLGLGVAAGVLWISIWAASEVFEGETVAFDEGVRQWVHGFASPAATSFFLFLSFIGSPLFLVCLGVVLLILFVYLKWRRATVLFLITMAGELTLDLLLKALYARARPVPFFDYRLPESFSFPSGHALGSFCFFGITAWLISQRIDNKAMSWAVCIVAAMLVFLIGLSRVYLGVHYPTDVIAGFVTGSVWLTTVLLCQRLVRSKAPAEV